MNDILFLTLLYDFYGELLTSKQKDIFYLYYQDNLSLSEIGELYGTTRQAVRDVLFRTENKLYFYENKLALVEKFTKQQKLFAEIAALIMEIKNNINSSDVILQCIERIKSIVELEEL